MSTCLIARNGLHVCRHRWFINSLPHRSSRGHRLSQAADAGTRRAGRASRYRAALEPLRDVHPCLEVVPIDYNFDHVALMEELHFCGFHRLATGDVTPIGAELLGASFEQYAFFRDTISPGEVPTCDVMPNVGSPG